MRSQRSAATKVSVFHLATGTFWPQARCPALARPVAGSCWSWPRSRRRRPVGADQAALDPTSTALAADPAPSDAHTPLGIPCQFNLIRTDSRLQRRAVINAVASDRYGRLEYRSQIAQHLVALVRGCRQPPVVPEPIEHGSHCQAPDEQV